MAKETCVFCGNEAGFMLGDFVPCGPVSQFACRSCAKEVKNLSEAERCRRALQRGLANEPQRIQEYLDTVENAEDARPACLRCGEKLSFGQVQTLDNSPYSDGLLSTSFDVLPAHCKKCGRIELFDPSYVSNDRFLTYLLRKDNEETN